MKKKVKDLIKDIFINKDFLYTILILLVGQAFIFFFNKFLQTNYHVVDIGLDYKIPFIPEFVYIYDFFYPFIFITLYVLFKVNKKDYFNAIISGTIAYLIAGVIFVLFPTIDVLRPEVINCDPITKFVLEVTYLADSPALNCFPSIHCAFTLQVIISYIMNKDFKNKTKIFVTIYGLLIIVSIFFIKQHYLLDLVGSMFLMTFTNWITIKFNLLKYIKKLKY